MAGPVLVCERYEHAYVPADAKAVRWLQSGKVMTVVRAFAAIEMVVDKLPIAPRRTSAVALVPRALAGAFAGAALSTVHRRGWALGSVLGAMGAIAGAFVAYRLRMMLETRKVPTLLSGLGEDALLFGLRRTVLARV
jgi:uncharacterized membrane protein